MSPLQIVLRESITWIECLAALIGLVQYRTVKNSYWKWFVCYLVFVAVAEVFSKFGLEYFPMLRRFYYDFFIIPIEFVFLFWLYARKSLQRKRLFEIATAIYLISFVPHLFSIEETRMINALSYTTGVLLLAIMAVMEFNKQVKSDVILQFQENKMFYVNVGVVLFYVGTLPFFAFDAYLYEHEPIIWNYYFIFFLIVVNLMYLLFAASLVWGKSKP